MGFMVRRRWGVLPLVALSFFLLYMGLSSWRSGNESAAEASLLAALQPVTASRFPSLPPGGAVLAIGSLATRTVGAYGLAIYQVETAHRQHSRNGNPDYDRWDREPSLDFLPPFWVRMPDGVIPVMAGAVDLDAPRVHTGDGTDSYDSNPPEGTHRYSGIYPNATVVVLGTVQITSAGPMLRPTLVGTGTPEKLKEGLDLMTDANRTIGDVLIGFGVFGILAAAAIVVISAVTRSPVDWR